MIDRFTSFDPNCEVGGFIIVAYLQSMWAEDIVPLIKQHNLENVDPQGWYPQQKWLNFLTEVYKMPDGPSRMVSVGMKVGQVMPFPPEITSFEQVMEGMHMSMEMSHRNGEWGWVKCETLKPKHVRMTNYSPYSDESVYGAYWAFAQRFLPPRADFTVVSSQAGKVRFPAADEPPLVIDFRWK
jgi:hypothetical protein